MFPENKLELNTFKPEGIDNKQLLQQWKQQTERGKTQSNQRKQAYEVKGKRYAAIGVDTDAVIKNC